MTLKSRWYDVYTAKRYDAELESGTDLARRRCIEELRLEPGSAVLDLGCGTGLSQPYLAEAVGEEGRVVGVDASRKMLKQAKERLRRSDLTERVELVRGDARKLGEVIAPGSRGEAFDAVLITLFLSVVPDWRGVFAQAFESLRDGGRCAVMDSYWPGVGWRMRLRAWRYAADATRPGFEPLQAATADFQMESFPPGTDAFYVASGTKG